MQQLLLAAMAVAVAGVSGRTQRVTVQGVASMEHVRNDFGNFFVIHDHEFADTRFATYDVTNELQCRFIALATFKTIYSISRDQNATIICKVFEHRISNQVKFQPKAGVTSFFQSRYSWHYPYHSGVFYDLRDENQKSFEQMNTSCPYASNFRRMPVTRNSTQKEIVKRLASVTQSKALYIGLEKRDDGFVWQGTEDRFDEDLVDGVLESLDSESFSGSGKAVVFTSEGEYKYVPRDTELAYICSYKPFVNSEWD